MIRLFAVLLIASVAPAMASPPMNPGSITCEGKITVDPVLGVYVIAPDNKHQIDDCSLSTSAGRQVLTVCRVGDECRFSARTEGPDRGSNYVVQTHGVTRITGP